MYSAITIIVVIIISIITSYNHHYTTVLTIIITTSPQQNKIEPFARSTRPHLLQLEKPMATTRALHMLPHNIYLCDAAVLGAVGEDDPVVHGGLLLL